MILLSLYLVGNNNYLALTWLDAQYGSAILCIIIGTV